MNQLMTSNSVGAALAKLKETNPGDANMINAYITDLTNKNVVALGSHEAFALTDGKGDIKAFKQSLTLSEADGTLVKPTFNSPFVLSAQGYNVWAAAVGATCIFAPEVVVNGESKPNPHIEYDKGDRVKAIYCRAIAYKFSSKGIPQVSDRTIIYDVPAYRMLDLLAKAKKFPQAFKLLPTDVGTPEVDGTWAKYHFDESTFLWVNTSHDKALEFYSQIINREKKALEFAQTFATRNALKHLSGIQKSPYDDNFWNIDVICWRPTNGNIIKWDPTEYISMREKVVDMVEGNTGAFESIQIDSGIDTISDDEMPVDDEGMIDVTQASKDVEKQEKVTESSLGNNPVYSESEQKLFNNYCALKDSCPDEYQKAVSELGEAKCPTDAEKVMARINQLIDEDNE